MAVLGDAGGDFWMGQLHEQRPPAREEQNHLAVHLPDHRVRREKSLVAESNCFLCIIYAELRIMTQSIQMKKAYRIIAAQQVVRSPSR